MSIMLGKKNQPMDIMLGKNPPMDITQSTSLWTLRWKETHQWLSFQA
jgi:hypothetical protein